MLVEPEASFELLSAITDYKIKVIKKVAEYYKPDAFTYYDDIATERSLFMSPDTYRQLIKPMHKRIADACWEEGIMPIQHTCGKADQCIDDYVETGAAAWTMVQSPNDIVGILKKYEGEFTLIGGFDMQGPPGMADATEEVVLAENMRMLKEYAHLTGFIGTYMSVGGFGGGADPDASMEEMMQAQMAAMMPVVAMIQEFEATQWKK